jgi:hypothetical protein
VGVAQLVECCSVPCVHGADEKTDSTGVLEVELPVSLSIGFVSALSRSGRWSLVVIK